MAKWGRNISTVLYPVNSILGVTWGKTIYSVISQLQSVTNHPVTAVQLTGSLKLVNPATDSRELVRMIASVYNGNYHYIDAPLYVKCKEMKGKLLKEPLIQDTLAITQNMNAVITGIGGKSSLPTTNSLFRPYLSEADIALAENCSGSIYGYILNENGEIADLELNQKVVAAPLENILRTPHRLAVVYGRHKASVTCKALRNQLFNEILTDTETARKLLEYAKS